MLIELFNNLSKQNDEIECDYNFFFIIRKIMQKQGCMYKLLCMFSQVNII